MTQIRAVRANCEKLGVAIDRIVRDLEANLGHAAKDADIPGEAFGSKVCAAIDAVLKTLC